MLSFFLALGLAASPLDAAGPTPEPASETHGAEAQHVTDLSEPPTAVGPKKLDWVALPLVSYNTDAKFGIGGAAQLQWSGVVDPYRYQLGIQALATTGGVQSHWIH